MVWYKFKSEGLCSGVGYRLLANIKEAKDWAEVNKIKLLGPANRQEVIDFCLKNDMFQDMSEEAKTNIINPKNYKL